MTFRIVAHFGCIAAAWSCMLLARPADALQITQSNVDRYTWNGVIHHDVGASFSYFVVNDYGGDTNSTDLGYALCYQISEIRWLFFLP
jgi:hypothetical protein